MRSTIKCLGIIAFVAIIGFGFTACGGEDDDSNTVSKTLSITIPETIFNQVNYGPDNGVRFSIGVFIAGTTVQQASNGIGQIAGCHAGTPGVDYRQNGSNYIVTLPLYDAITDERWTGSGTFEIYMELGNNNYYKVSSVNISSATTSIAISASNAVQP